MSRKDYIRLAQDLKAVLRYRADTELDVANAIIMTVAAALKRDNPRFDTERFMQACWPED